MAGIEIEMSIYSAGYKYIAGIDEAGRGPLAGPVVSSAVILDINNIPDGINDSKLLSAKKREMLFDMIMESAIAVGVGIVSNIVIDKINIYNATKLAMKRAIDLLNIRPDFLLIDAVELDLKIPYTSIIKGDRISLSIAAASIIAKVIRDRIMLKIDKIFPQYKFAKNKGYPTKEHIDAIKRYGITPVHRKTYKPVREYIDGV